MASPTNLPAVPSPKPGTILSLLQQRERARERLTGTTTELEAAKYATNLCGQFPSLRADNPKVFLASVAAVLSTYPPGLVQECCDPRTGLARRGDFLSIGRLCEWLDTRLANYRTIAAYSPARLPYIEQEHTPEHRTMMLRRLQDLFRSIFRPDQTADAIRKRYNVTAEQWDQIPDAGTR